MEIKRTLWSKIQGMDTEGSGPEAPPFGRPKSYKIICSGCGKEVVVQVPPPDDKKRLCMECFKK